jgi:hypothetical protein
LRVFFKNGVVDHCDVRVEKLEEEDFDDIGEFLF